MKRNRSRRGQQVQWPRTVLALLGKNSHEKVRMSGCTSVNQSTINFDAKCTRCSYRLFGLPIETECPECGLPIAESIRPELLQFAPSAWVRKIKWGLVFNALSFFLIPVAMFMPWILLAMNPNVSPMMMFAVLGLAILILPLVTAITFLIAIWFLTADEEQSLFNRQHLYCGTARVFGFAYLVVTAICLMLSLFMSRKTEIAVGLPMFTQLGNLFGIAAFSAVLIRCSWIAMRVPDNSWTQIIRWGGLTAILLFCLVICGYILAWLAERSLLPVSESHAQRIIESCISTLCFFGPFVVSITALTIAILSVLFLRRIRIAT